MGTYSNFQVPVAAAMPVTDAKIAFPHALDSHICLLALETAWVERLSSETCSALTLVV